MTLKRFLFLLLLCSAALITQAGEPKIYVWKKSDGTLVFSDKPQPGAKQVTLKGNVLSMPATDTSVLNEQKKADQEIHYQVEITTPKAEATIRDNNGTVHISGRVTPRMVPGFKVQLILDGQPHGKPQSSSVFVLKNVDRGAHSVELKLTDQLDEVVAISPPVTFYLHRISVLTGT